MADPHDQKMILPGMVDDNPEKQKYKLCTGA